jgi:hypothetical protein
MYRVLHCVVVPVCVCCRVLLGKIPETDGKMSYVYDKHIFHYIVDNGMTFLCMADESTKRRITFAFLEDIKSLWRERIGEAEKSALAFSLNDMFSPILRQRMEYYAGNPTATDNISRVQAQIDNVKDVMMENIDKLLERGEILELLVDKTEKLNAQAFKFEKTVCITCSWIIIPNVNDCLLCAIVTRLEEHHVLPQDKELFDNSICPCGKWAFDLDYILYCPNIC